MFCTVSVNVALLPACAVLGPVTTMDRFATARAARIGSEVTVTVALAVWPAPSEIV